jgi:hypothetical protein
MKRQTTRLEAFLSLNWYEVALRFLFTFVAKTSEVLLGAGLVVSTANFLTDGNILTTHPGISVAWAWAQALAIDSSLGVTFSYAFQCLKKETWIQGILYGLLMLLLAGVAGAITTVDIVSHALHVSTSDAIMQMGINVIMLSRLRAVAVIGFILMSRLRDLPMTDLLTNTEPEPQRALPPISGDRVQATIQSLCLQFNAEEMAQILNACITAKKIVFARVSPEEIPGPHQPPMDQQRQSQQPDHASELNGTGAAQMESEQVAGPSLQSAPEAIASIEPSRKAPVATELLASMERRHHQNAPEPFSQMRQIPEPIVGVPLEEPVVEQEPVREPQDGTVDLSEPEAAPPQERLEQAYQSLVAEGKKPSGRALAERAHVHRSTCVEWLRTRHREELPQEESGPEELFLEQLQSLQLSEPMQRHQEPELEYEI